VGSGKWSGFLVGGSDGAYLDFEGVLIMSNVKSISVPGLNLPEGDYCGKWSGYVVDVCIHEVEYKIETTNGVRGLCVPCIVSVRGGEVNVSTV
jgi:hypothetical protein